MIQDLARRMRANIQTVMVGKDEVIDQALAAVLCEGHVLLEDVPGIGKTTLARALAASLGCTFQRIQFTPDLLPSDVTGINWFNQLTQAFEYRPGPLMGQVVLADEINRATPRTQSALLEAMQERQVTVDGVTRALPRPFLVLATQNPVELEGTFPLPEAQLDRFLMRVEIGYPSAQEEAEILERFGAADPLLGLRAVTTPAEVMAAQAARRAIRVEHSIPRLHDLHLRRHPRTPGDRARGQPARLPGHLPGLPGMGGHRWTRLRSARRCQADGAGGAHASADDRPSGPAARPAA